MNSTEHIEKTSGRNIRFWLFALAPFLSVCIVLFGDLDPQNPQITYMLAVTVLVALWWVTEIVPLGITSLLPVVLFPLFGIMDGAKVSAVYFNDIIFLFMGGFL